MIATHVRATHSSSLLLTAARTAIAAAVVSLAGTGAASAYVGDSFLNLPGVTGDWQGAQYKNWVRADANYWPGQPWSFRGKGGGGGLGRNQAMYSGPNAPEKGEHALVISIDKHSAILPQLMAACANKTSFPEATFAESSQRARAPLQIGPRPADMPEYFEYKLTEAQVSDCPVVADAPDQAIVVSFKDIQWSNYHGSADGEPVTMKPVDLKPAKLSGTTKSYVLTWFANANYVSDDQCPKMGGKSTEDEYYALMTKEDADKERVENAKHGGVSYANNQMAMRGPHKLNACALPGIVKDSVQPLPQSKVARGINLDGNDGTGAPAAGTCAHKNFVSEDGEPGIDNQLFAAVGCTPGLEGKKGFMMQFVNNQMHDGLVSILVQITGVDNAQNDNSVDVALFYSLDPMSKSASGTQIMPHYTFRVTDNPQYTHFFTHVHGHIVNGVLTTDTIKDFQMNLSYYGTPHVLKLADARLRLNLMPDGTLKGVVGGYEDWKTMMTVRGSSTTEQYFEYDCPAIYNALKHAADGLKNPVTGECDGISAAYDMEGIPAFIGPAEHKVAKDKDHHQVAQADTSGQKAP